MMPWNRLDTFSTNHRRRNFRRRFVVDSVFVVFSLFLLLLFTQSFQGLFGNERLKTPQDFAQLNKDVRTNCSTIINQIVNGRDDRTTVELFDDLSNEICKAADLVECTRQLHSDPAYNRAAEESARDFCELVERFVHVMVF